MWIIVIIQSSVLIALLGKKIIRFALGGLVKYPAQLGLHVICTKPSHHSQLNNLMEIKFIEVDVVVWNRISICSSIVVRRFLWLKLYCICMMCSNFTVLHQHLYPTSAINARSSLRCSFVVENWSWIWSFSFLASRAGFLVACKKSTIAEQRQPLTQNRAVQLFFNLLACTCCDCYAASYPLHHYAQQW